MRQAIVAHAGEAQASRAAFDALADDERDAIVEFLKTLRMLPPGSRNLIVDEFGAKKTWPPG